jgi:hypothetical protein
MDRSPWHLAVIIPVGILAIGFMVYTMSLFRQQHVMMLLTMLSDCALLTIFFHTLSGILFFPTERANLLNVRTSKKSAVIITSLASLLGLSIFLHVIATLHLLNSPSYASIIAIPLLLVAFNRLF